MAKISLRLRDYSDEYTSVGVNIADLADIGTWDAQNAKADAFQGHVEAHALGTVVVHSVSQETMDKNDARPASAIAQRESGFRFYVRDSVNDKLGYFTVGTADLTIASVQAGTDLLDLTAEPTASFVTWLEANVISEDGNAVTVERAKIVGRNS